jgi:ABC-type taurine transport system substrate-binding protein
VDVLAVSPEFARSRAGDVRALVRTWWAAQDFARRLPTEAVAEMAQRQQITPEQFRQSEQGLRYPDSAKQLDLLRAKGPVERALAGMAAQMRQAGRIEAAAPLPRTSTGFLVTP